MENANDLGMEPARASSVTKTGTPSGHDENTQHLHAIGDEPALIAHQLNPENAPGFAQYYIEKRNRTTNNQRWIACITAMLFAGPFAVIGALITQTSTWWALLLICVFGPIIEEILKIAGVYYLAEQRPWLVINRLSLVIIACISGLTFGLIENLIYIYIYIQNPSPEIIFYRWVVCTALHVTCSTIAGFGIAQMWHKSHTTAKPANPAIATPYLVTAILIHMIYNTFAVGMSISNLIPWN